MRSLDTNVLVRYLVNDDPKQAQTAERILDDCRDNREPVFLSILVLCELVWVLDRSYGQTKAQILAVLEKLLEMDLFRIEQESLVRQSLNHYRPGKGSFPDYLIGEISQRAGCRDTVSFDRALKGAPGFTVLA
jgi:predicted nucleic-acid-binding protein